VGNNTEGKGGFGYQNENYMGLFGKGAKKKETTYIKLLTEGQKGKPGGKSKGAKTSNTGRRVDSHLSEVLGGSVCETGRGKVFLKGFDV